MSFRLQKISSLLKEELSLIFLQKLNDPDLGLVTVTSVKVTPDLKIARIYISVYDKEKREVVLAKVKKATPLIRSEIGRRVRLRAVPDLEFFIDDTLDYVEKMDDLFRKIKENDKPDEQ